MSELLNLYIKDNSGSDRILPREITLKKVKEEFYLLDENKDKDKNDNIVSLFYNFKN